MAIFDSGIEGGQHCCVSDIKKTYQSMLTPFKAKLGDVKDGLTSMPLMKGAKFNKNIFNEKPIRILFVGRAVNGWEIDFRDGTIDEIVDQVFQSAVNIGDIAKGTVTNQNGDVVYNYNKSPFFQLCHALMNMYNMEENWSDRMAWTNLYKVAPYKKGNPNNGLIRETLNDCATILRKEISYLRPTHIVFITDAWWYKPTGKGLNEKAFINEIGVDLYENTNQIIIGSGISEAFHFKPKVVITKRPEGAKITRKDHAKAIYDAFNSITSVENNI